MLIHHEKRRGFTLVELLVVITIIGILISLTLPAVSSVRERGRMLQCANNMREITKAMVAFESSHQILPPNWGGYPPMGWYSPGITLTNPSTSTPDSGDQTKVRGNSWQTQLLPGLDQMNLYTQLSLGGDLADKDPNISKQNLNQTVAQTVLPIFRCPSDSAANNLANQILTIPPSPLGTTISPYPAVTNYKACIGNNWPNDPVPMLSTGTNPTYQHAYGTAMGRNHGTMSSSTWTPPAAPTGGDNDLRDLCNGIMCRGWRANNNYPLYTTAMSDILDGASNTIAVGESLPLYCAFSSWYWFNGSSATVTIPLNYLLNRANVPGGDPTQTASNTAWQTCSGFMSRHPQGANFGFCDGSVHFLSENIDTTTYRYLGSMQDGQTVDMTQAYTQ